MGKQTMLDDRTTAPVLYRMQQGSTMSRSSIFIRGTAGSRLARNGNGVGPHLSRVRAPAYVQC